MIIAFSDFIIVCIIAHELHLLLRQNLITVKVNIGFYMRIIVEKELIGKDEFEKSFDSICHIRVYHECITSC